MEFGIKLLESVIQELRDMPDEEFMALYRQNTSAKKTNREKDVIEPVEVTTVKENKGK